jgi:hypothetical protein
MALQTATATFNGAQSLDGDLPYIDVTWPTAYSSSSVYRVALGVNTSDGPLAIMFKSKTASGVRVLASDQFSGTVELVAYDI